MKLTDLKDQRVAVIGAGQEGLSTVRYLLRHQIPVTVCDRLDDPPAKQELDSVEWRTGPAYLETLSDFDVAFRTPLRPILSAEIQQAIADGVGITSQTKFFFDNCPAPIVGVTGTKGKGFTASVTAEMLRATGRKVFLGGNIGTASLDFLDEVGAEDLVVLELSSFQLQDLEQSPRVAVLTNLLSDHLDYHRDLAEYGDAKAPLFRFQSESDLAIFNADDPGSRKIADQASGRIKWFSLEKSDADGRLDGDQLVADGTAVCATKEIPVRGLHFQRNALAAALAAADLGATPSQIATGIRNYQPMPYRLQPVGEHNGVTIINDGYSTIPEATVAGLESFDEPVVLICGGQTKNLDYRGLAEAIVRKPAKAVVLTGEVGEEIRQAVITAAERLKAEPPRLEVANKREEILPKALELAEPGDVILYSPAATSFDWFKNVGERGQFFTDEVLKLS